MELRESEQCLRKAASGTVLHKKGVGSLLSSTVFLPNEMRRNLIPIFFLKITNDFFSVYIELRVGLDV